MPSRPTRVRQASSPPDAAGGERAEGVTVALRRVAYRAAFRGLRVWWFVRRPHTSGVKLVVWRDDDVLFVRHSYGDTSVWELPGGGRRRGESPERAASRELREELGLDVTSWTRVGSFVSRRAATATLTCMVTEFPGGPVKVARAEILEVRWAPAAAPPSPLGEHARATLDLAAEHARDR